MTLPSSPNAPTERASNDTEPSRTILLTVAYDGSAYAGFAMQRNAHTVAEALLDAIAHFDPAVRTLRVASRTDAGVHARCNQVAFDTTRDMPVRAWVHGLMPRLPDDVAVRVASRVPAGFTPRFAAKRKRYRYLLLVDRYPDPQWARRAWRVWGLDREAAARMERELAAVAGTHEFSAFASARDEREHRERTLAPPRVRWREGEGALSQAPMVAIDVEGDSFLHNMVRILVGTAVDVGLGRRPEGTVATALASGDRSLAGQTAPPDGLYLDELILEVERQETWPRVAEPVPG